MYLRRDLSHLAMSSHCNLDLIGRLASQSTRLLSGTDGDTASKATSLLIHASLLKYEALGMCKRYPEGLKMLNEARKKLGLCIALSQELFKQPTSSSSSSASLNLSQPSDHCMTWVIPHASYELAELEAVRGNWLKARNYFRMCLGKNGDIVIDKDATLLEAVADAKSKNIVSNSSSQQAPTSSSVSSTVSFLSSAGNWMMPYFASPVSPTSPNSSSAPILHAGGVSDVTLSIPENESAANQQTVTRPQVHRRRSTTPFSMMMHRDDQNKLKALDEEDRLEENAHAHTQKNESKDHGTLFKSKRLSSPLPRKRSSSEFTSSTTATATSSNTTIRFLNHESWRRRCMVALEQVEKGVLESRRVKNDQKPVDMVRRSRRINRVYGDEDYNHDNDHDDDDDDEEEE